jgi:hypothetical protein
MNEGLERQKTLQSGIRLLVSGETKGHLFETNEITGIVGNDLEVSVRRC